MSNPKCYIPWIQKAHIEWGLLELVHSDVLFDYLPSKSKSMLLNRQRLVDIHYDAYKTY